MLSFIKRIFKKKEFDYSGDDDFESILGKKTLTLDEILKAKGLDTFEKREEFLNKKRPYASYSREEIDQRFKELDELEEKNSKKYPYNR